MKVIFPNLKTGAEEVFVAPNTTISAEEAPEGRLVMFSSRTRPGRLMAVWVVVEGTPHGFHVDLTIQGVGELPDFRPVPGHTLATLANGRLLSTAVTDEYQHGHLFHEVNGPKVSLEGVTLTLAPVLYF